LLAHPQLNVPIKGCFLHMLAPKPVAFHERRRHPLARLLYQPIVSLDSLLSRDGFVRPFGEVAFQLKESLRHKRRRLRSKPGSGVLSHHVFDGPLGRPQQTLPHPLVEMVLCAARMRHVSYAVAHALVEVPMVVTWPREERQPVIDHREGAIRAAFVEEMVPW